MKDNMLYVRDIIEIRKILIILFKNGISNKIF